ncbi:MAG: ferrous iron transport protein A [Sulfurovaceae bacterium]|nr:ferrous iron transport protein A [Sulfurovaceae bacterium]
MTIADLNKNQKAKIKATTASEPIKSRLFAMGFVKGVEITLLQHTLAKNTYDVEVNQGKVALREEEAKTIEVELI